MDSQIFNAKDLDWIKLKTGRSKVLVGRDVSKSGEFRLLCLDPGEIFEDHEHDFLQCMYFTRGTGRVSIDDSERKIEPGLTVIVLPKQCHSVSNTGDEEMEIIVVEMYEMSVQNTPFVDF